MNVKVVTQMIIENLKMASVNAWKATLMMARKYAKVKKDFFYGYLNKNRVFFK